MEALGLKTGGKPDLSRDKSEDDAQKNNEEKARQNAEKVMKSVEVSKLFADYYLP